MHGLIRALLISFFLFQLPGLIQAAPYYGINASIILLSRVPAPLYGYQVMLNYDPQRFIWHHLNLSFDGGFSRFHDPHYPIHTHINIYSLAPVLRYQFDKQGLVAPFLEFSIGLAYLNKTHIEKRNLGIHFAFQDRFGLGAFLGQAENFTIGLHAVHFSNAHFSNHNSGITVPLLLDIGYRFD